MTTTLQIDKRLYRALRKAFRKGQRARTLSKQNKNILTKVFGSPGHQELIDSLFLTTQYHPDLYFDGETPLSKAVKMARLEYVPILLRHGASPVFPDGSLILSHLSRRYWDHQRSIGVLEAIEDSGMPLSSHFEVNDIQTTVLHEASLEHNYDLVVDLINGGMNVNVRDGCGRTAIHSLVQNGVFGTETVEKILEALYEIDVDVLDDSDRTAVSYLNDSNIKLLKLFVDRGADLNAGIEPATTKLLKCRCNKTLWSPNSFIITQFVRGNADFSLIDPNCLRCELCSKLLHSLNIPITKGCNDLSF